jgi:hypothetical protein
MRTTLKIETPTKTIEVALKLVEGKQIVELELADLLSLFEGKSTKTSVASKEAKAPKTAKAPKEPKGPKVAATAPKVGAKRGRKPKAGVQGETVSEAVVDPTV